MCDAQEKSKGRPTLLPAGHWAGMGFVRFVTSTASESGRVVAATARLETLSDVQYAPIDPSNPGEEKALGS